MTFLEAAVAILETSLQPMTTNEITREALAQGLLRSQGKTPEATMSATLYAYTNREGPKRVIRLQDLGTKRARRGSVRWALAEWDGLR